MPETEKFYESVSVKKAKAYINTALDEFEANEQLESLAKDMINGKNPFPEKVKNWAAALTVDRLRNISEKQGDEFQKNIYDQLASDLSAVRNKDVTIAATQTGLEAEASKILPSSKQGLVDFAEKAYSEAYDSRLSKEQQADIKSFAEQITELLKTDEAQKAIAEAVESEIEKIATETEGADWLEDMKSIRDSLKIDLSEC